MAGVWTIRLVILLLCLCFTCCQVETWVSSWFSDFLFFFFSPTGSCVGFRFLYASASSKLFYRKFPMRLFCSYTLQAPQKWLSCRSWKKREREVQRKQTSKACRRHSKTERGRGGREELRRFNRGELKLRHFL